MKRVALYVRVSTDEQKKNGLSVDNQIDALTTFCEENNYIIEGIYNDAGISARKSFTRRPALLDMLNHCQNGLVDLVIFTRLDRFFRSVPDYYACIEQMNNVPWKAIWEDYETETSAGIFKVNIMLSIAQAEADRTSEKIKSVNAYRRSQGEYTCGKAPLGYKSVKGHIIIDEEKKEAVQAFFSTYLATGSMARAYSELSNRGISLARTNAQKLLVNPTFYGDAWGVPCEPYITKEQHERIKELKKSKTRTPKIFGRTYIFSGLIKCAVCGNNYAGDVRKLKNGERLTYRCNSHREFKCPNSRTVNEDFIEQFLVDNIMNEIKAYNIELEAHQKELGDTQKKISALNAKLDRILDMYEDGFISKDEYKTKSDNIKKELASLQIHSVEFVELSEDAMEIYTQLDSAHKHSFWMQTIDHITIDENKNIKIFF